MPETEKVETKAAAWKGRIAAAEKNKDTYLKVWQESVNYRAMKPFPMATTDNVDHVDRVALSEDWSRTKAKTAELAFKLPKIVAGASRPEFQDSAPIVTALVNKTLRRLRAHYVVDECLADVINAAGVMAAVVGMDIRTEEVPISSAPLPAANEIVAPPFGDVSPIADLVDTSAGPVDLGDTTPTKPALVSVRRRIYQSPTLNRISPADLLWPADFRLSDWRKAPWLGYTTTMTEVEIRREWEDKIPDDWQAESVKVEGTLADDLRPTSDQSVKSPTVEVTVIFYYAACYDADKSHPECIRSLTFIDGIDDPVEEGDVDEQMWVPEQPEIPAGPNGEPGSPAVRGHYEGLTRLPILVETLAYVSDTAIPPSDSEVGRSSVRELMRSRSQMIRQRDHSVPIRWYDTNRLDETVIDGLRAGRWQDMIPVNGPGDRIVGEVSRAAYPRENFSFDAVIRQGLDQAWSLSNPALGLPNAETKSATEVSAMGAATSKRSDYEKERVNRFVVAIAETLYSLMQRYDVAEDYVEIVGEDGAETLVAVKPLDLKGQHEFDFVSDSSDRLDAQTRQVNIIKMYNLMANSPSINRRELERQVWIEFGQDPKKMMAPPAEPAPEQPNISYRFGGEDMLNPIAVALLLKANAITPKEIADATLLIQDAIRKTQTTDASIVPDPSALQDVPPGGGGGKVEPPETNAPILKRAEDGSRLV